jgi:cytoskeletal protein RodZ
MADQDLKIGNRLQEARRLKKVNISLAARDLCIPQKYLNAFEKNDTTSLPEPIYAVGFIRTYAEYLGLDPDPLVEDLKANFNEPAEPTNSFYVSPKSGGATLGILLFLVIAGSLGYFGLASMAEPTYTVQNTGEIPDHIANLLEEEDAEDNQ